MSDTFPIQGGLRIPMWAAERAYETYAKLFGRDQSLQRLGERGGFGLLEWGALFAGHNPAGMHNQRLEQLTVIALQRTFVNNGAERDQ